MGLLELVYAFMKWIGLDDALTAGGRGGILRLVGHFGVAWCNLNKFHSFGSALRKNKEL